jgi:hypothetical protein
MKEDMVSDQLGDWSDSEEAERCLIAKETSTTCPSTHPTRNCSAWVTYRALQALWEARVPLRRRSRPRSKVLPVDQSVRSSAADALCPSELLRTGGELPRSLSEGSADPERNCEHQPGASEAPRAILERLYGGSGSGFSPDRGRRRGCTARQYARGFVAGTDGAKHGKGGVP